MVLKTNYFGKSLWSIITKILILKYVDKNRIITQQSLAAGEDDIIKVCTTNFILAKKATESGEQIES